MSQPFSNTDLGLPPGKFYGSKSIIKEKEKNDLSEDTVNKCENSKIGLDKEPLPFKLNRLSGPSQTWKIFKKQSNALACAKMRKNGLMAFAFQQSTGERLFLVAHPRVFWHYDSRRIPKQRCTYEIIPEHSVCKLYFDLEYDTAYNPNCVGNDMVETFISIVCYYIKEKWGIDCTRKNVLDLDSTTDIKFSRHLIFQLPSAVFRNNHHVGNFVKYVCNEIRSMCNVSAIEDLPVNNKKQSTTNLSCEPFANRPMLNLMINDKGKLKLFCDEAVYSKNRHFRLFQSTKHGKNAPLLLSPQNMFGPSCTSYDITESIFLNSLVTYVATESSLNFKVLEFGSASSNQRKCTDSSNEVISNAVHRTNTIYPFLDSFIEKLVSPGHIWRSAFFATTNIIVYDIVGNRYCGNIGREHRSNNIKYVVDIEQCCYYQKCYDPDCSNYRSLATKLVPELCFMLEDDSLILNDCNLANSQGDFFDTALSKVDLLEVLNVVEDISAFDFQDD